MNKIIKSQDNPKPGKDTVVDYVLSDIHERVEDGTKKYGSPLQTFNGRSALWDAYQEAIDLVFYLRQAILEQAHLTPTEADSPMAPVCGRCGQRKCTCQHGPYPIIGERA